MNERSLKTIDSLHPDIRHKVTIALSDVNCKLTGNAQVVLVSGLRDFKEQSGLYALGRTKVNPDGRSTKKPMGNIVTNAKSGQSIHNYGLAFDMALLINGKIYSWDTLKDFDNDGISDWMEAVEIFKAHGFEWGGDWRFKDEPHFQMDFGYSWQQLQAKYNLKEFIAGTKYVNLSREACPDIPLYRTTASLNFRSAGSTSASVIMVILKGEQVTQISKDGIWSRVSYNGQIGYVSNKYLSK